MGDLLQLGRCKNEPPPPQVKEEWTISSKGILVLLLIFIVSRHSHADRERAQALCAGFLGAMLIPEHLGREWAMAESVDVARLCREGQDQGLCAHVRSFRNGPLQNPALHGPWMDFVHILVSLMQAGADCAACKALLGRWLDRLVGLIEDTAHQNLDLLADPSKATVLMGKKRKLRIDEDLKRKWSFDDLLAKRVHSASQAARFAGFFGSSASGCTRAWEDQGLSQYMVASWKVFEHAGVVGISSDGKRLGNPAEETNTYTAWSADQNLAVWLPPQALFDVSVLIPASRNTH